MERRLSCVLCGGNWPGGSQAVTVDRSAAILKPVCSTCAQRLEWINLLRRMADWLVVANLAVAMAGGVMFAAKAQVAPPVLKWLFCSLPLIAVLSFGSPGRFQTVVLWAGFFGAVAIGACLHSLFGYQPVPNDGAGLVEIGLLVAAACSFGMRLLGLMLAFGEALTRPISASDASQKSKGEDNAQEIA